MKYYSLKCASFGYDQNNLKKLFPKLNGYFVDNSELVEGNHKNDFLPETTKFDYLSFNTPILDDQDVWCLNDVHQWGGMYSFQGVSFVLCEKLKKILSKYNLTPNRFYPTRVLYNNVYYDYYIFQVLQLEFQNFIDLRRTVFTEWERGKYIGLNEYKVSEPNEIENIDDLIFEKHKKFYDIGFKKVAFKKEFESIDLWWHWHLDYVISEPLKNAIEDAETTGIEIKEIENVEFIS